MAAGLVRKLGILLVDIVGTLWLVVLLRLLLSFLVRSRMIGGLLPILLFAPSLTAGRWTCSVTQAVQRTSLWPASCLPAVDKSRGSKSVEVRRVWDIYDERLQFMSRRDALLAIRGWRNWLLEDPLVHPYKVARPDLVPPAPFLQCEPHLTPGGSAVLADPARIDEEFRKARLPNFCRFGQRDTSLEEFSFEVKGWLPLLPVFELPRLTGQMLADVVQRKGATACSLDGWEWGELKGFACFLV